MILSPRRRTSHQHVACFDIGTQVIARPPTVRTDLIGVVVSIDRYVLTIETNDQMTLAVDIEDCDAIRASPDPDHRPGPRFTRTN